MSSVDRILAQWREERAALNPGASGMQLESLERVLGMTLPADLRSFYSAANGMEDYKHDSRMVCMWSTDRIVRERNVHEGEDEWGTYLDLAFADVIVYAWHYRYRLRAGARMSIIAEPTSEEFPSLFAFFEALLRRPESLALPEDLKSP